MWGTYARMVFYGIYPSCGSRIDPLHHLLASFFVGQADKDSHTATLCTPIPMSLICSGQRIMPA